MLSGKLFQSLVFNEAISLKWDLHRAALEEKDFREIWLDSSIFNQHCAQMVRILILKIHNVNIFPGDRYAQV